MTDWREELIEKMARYIACASSSEDDPTTEWCDENWPAHENQARAALAAAEPVIREQAESALREENARLREALIDILASLVASVDLLERGGKKAAPSDKMFAQMLVDYKNSIERGRAVAAAIREGGKDD